MGRSALEEARDELADAKTRLARTLHDAITPGVDAGGLIEELEEFVDARVKYIRLRDED